MGSEQTREFISKLIEDEELARRANRAYIDALLGIAAEEGYEFTREELTQAIKEMSPVSLELSDEQLDMIAGGTAIESKLDLIGDPTGGGTTIDSKIDSL